MRDTDLYGRPLGIEGPWEVTDVELRLEVGEVDAFWPTNSHEPILCPWERATTATAREKLTPEPQKPTK